MKKSFYNLIPLSALLISITISAQETPNDTIASSNESKDFYENLKASEIAYLNDEHDRYVSELKLELKNSVERINQMLADEKITSEQAGKMKESYAEDVATRITAHRVKTDADIEFTKVKGSYTFGGTSVELSPKKGLRVKVNDARRKKRKYIRTSSGFALSFGHNFMTGDVLGFNDFSYPRNNFFSLGYQWKTTLDKDRNNFRLVYGVHYQTHGTELNGGRFITQGEQSVLAPLSQIIPAGAELEKAKFRQDQFIFPLHLEVGGSNRKEYEDGRVRFDEFDSWKFGIGGFVGFNASTRFKLRYEIDNDNVKQISIGNFDNNVFLYGLDAYVGWDTISLFGRLNLNDVFQNGSVDAQYVAFGIRFQ